MLVQRYGNFGWQCHESGVRERLRKSPLGRFSNNRSRFGSGSWWRYCYRWLIIIRNNLNCICWGIFLGAAALGTGRTKCSLQWRPSFSLWCFSPLANAEASGDTGAWGWKMGSPSASNKLPVSISHTGYFLDGFTFVAKFWSVKTRGLTAVPSSCSKWEYKDALMLNSE